MSERGSGRPEGRGKKVRGPYPLQGWPLPEAAGGSNTGGREAAPRAIRRLPCCPRPASPRWPPRLPAHPLTARVRGTAGGLCCGVGPHAHALCCSGRTPTRERRSTEPRGVARRDKRRQSPYRQGRRSIRNPRSLRPLHEPPIGRRIPAPWPRPQVPPYLRTAGWRLLVYQNGERACRRRWLWLRTSL